MSGIDSWSITPATNATADGGAINWAEGQPPSTVNNTARQMLADIRSRENDLIWFVYGTGDQGAGNLAVPAVYASGTSFTIAGADVTAAYHVGRRVRAVGVSTGTIFGNISSTAYAPTTTTVAVQWDSGSLANETLVISLSQIPVTGSPVPLQRANRFYSGAVSDPSATTSATYVMCGLGSSWALTPRTTGRVRVMVTGLSTNNTSTADTFTLGKYGTGTAPISGAAVTGTSLTTSEVRITATAAASPFSAFTYYAEVSGLTIGTAYWFDLANKTTSGSGSVSQLVVSIIEIA